jgi:hypothetical protein
MCAVALLLTPSANAATRSASTTGTLTLMWAGNNGSGSMGVILPFFYPMSTAVNTTYSSSYDSRTGRYNVTLQKVDEYVSVTNGQYGPCGVSAALSSSVLQNRTTNVLTISRASSGSTQNYYWTNPGTLIYGFTNTRPFTTTNPRLQTTATAASYQCIGWRNLTTNIDLP